VVAVIAGLYLFYFLQALTDGFFYRLGFVHAFLFLLMSAAASRTIRLSKVSKHSQPRLGCKARRFPS
jgi:hypothetical protein